MATVQFARAANDQTHQEVEKPGNQAHPHFKRWVQNFNTAMFQTGVFGGSIVFSVLMSELPDPIEHSRFSIHTVRLFLAIAWAGFTFNFGASWLIGLYYTDAALRNIQKSQKLGNTEKEWRWVRGWYAGGLVVVCLFTIVTFIFLSLAVAAYVPVVGFLVCVALSTYALGILYLTARLMFKPGSLLEIPN